MVGVGVVRGAWVHGSNYRHTPTASLAGARGNGGAGAAPRAAAVQPNRWYKVDILLDWANYTYRLRLDDATVALDQPFTGEGVTRVGLYVFDTTTAYFDELFVGQDDGLGFECPLGVEEGAALRARRPLETGWDTEDVGPESAHWGMLRHSNHLSRRDRYQPQGGGYGQVPWDGMPERAFHADTLERRDAEAAAYAALYPENGPRGGVGRGGGDTMNHAGPYMAGSGENGENGPLSPDGLTGGAWTVPFAHLDGAPATPMLPATLIGAPLSQNDIPTGQWAAVGAEVAALPAATLRGEGWDGRAVAVAEPAPRSDPATLAAAGLLPRAPAPAAPFHAHPSELESPDGTLRAGEVVAGSLLYVPGDVPTEELLAAAQGVDGALLGSKRGLNAAQNAAPYTAQPGAPLLAAIFPYLSGFSSNVSTQRLAAALAVAHALRASVGGVGLGVGAVPEGTPEADGEWSGGEAFSESGGGTEGWGAKGGYGGATGRHYWHGEHDNPRHLDFLVPGATTASLSAWPFAEVRPWRRGGIGACSTAGLSGAPWRNEGLVLHYANISAPAAVMRAAYANAGLAAAGPAGRLPYGNFSAFPITASSTSTSSPTISPTTSPSPTRSSTPTGSHSPNPTATPGLTRTRTGTGSTTKTVSRTSSNTRTPSRTSSTTRSISKSPTTSGSVTPSLGSSLTTTPTPTSSRSATPTPTPPATRSPSRSATLTLSVTPTATPFGDGGASGPPDVFSSGSFSDDGYGVWGDVTGSLGSNPPAWVPAEWIRTVAAFPFRCERPKVILHRVRGSQPRYVMWCAVDQFFDWPAPQEGEALSSRRRAEGTGSWSPPTPAPVPDTMQPSDGLPRPPIVGSIFSADAHREGFYDVNHTTCGNCSYGEVKTFLQLTGGPQPRTVRPPLRLRLAGVAVSRWPAGPFNWVWSLRPDSNATVDFTLVQSPPPRLGDAPAPAYLARTYYATESFVMPRPVMQPVWESVKNGTSNGSTELDVRYDLNYHRAWYIAGYDNPEDIWLQRWRMEDQPWKIENEVLLETYNHTPKPIFTLWNKSYGALRRYAPENRSSVLQELASNSTTLKFLIHGLFANLKLDPDGTGSTDVSRVPLPSNPSGLVLHDYNFRGQGIVPITSRYLDPARDDTNYWMPESVPAVKAKEWKFNYRDTNIADNPPHPTVPDLLQGEYIVVQRRRTKYVALSQLTPDYLNTTGAITVLEGETLNGDTLLAALGDTLRGARGAGAAAGSRFLWDAGTGNGANTTAMPDVYTAWKHPFSEARPGGVVTFPKSFEPTVDWQDRFWQYNITHEHAEVLCRQQPNYQIAPRGDPRVNDANWVCAKPLGEKCNCPNSDPSHCYRIDEVDKICRTLDFRNFRDRKDNSTCPNMHRRARIILGNCTRVLWDITHTSNTSVPSVGWEKWDFKPTPFSLGTDVMSDKYGYKHAYEFVPTEAYEECLSSHAKMLFAYDACLQGLVPDLNELDEWSVKNRECVGGGGKCGPPAFPDFQAPRGVYGFQPFDSSLGENGQPTWPTWRKPKDEPDNYNNSLFRTGMREPDIPFIKPHPPAPDALRSYYGVDPAQGENLISQNLWPPLWPPGSPYYDFPARKAEGEGSWGLGPNQEIGWYINRKEYRGDRAPPPRRRLLDKGGHAEEARPRARVLDEIGRGGAGDDEPLTPQELALHRAWREKEDAPRGGGA